MKHSAHKLFVVLLLSSMVKAHEVSISERAENAFNRLCRKVEKMVSRVNKRTDGFDIAARTTVESDLVTIEGTESGVKKLISDNQVNTGRDCTLFCKKFVAHSMALMAGGAAYLGLKKIQDKICTGRKKIKSVITGFTALCLVFFIKKSSQPSIPLAILLGFGGVACWDYAGTKVMEKKVK